MTAPLILTLALDSVTFARLDAERRALFPDRGYRLPAHLTLFHALPGEDHAAIGRTLLDLAATTGPLPLDFAEVIDLRPGAAYRVRSEALERLRADLAGRWQDRLTRQDRQGWRPHVTVQNKVAAEDSAYPRLAAGFAPFGGAGTGLLLWHYRGGPWEEAGDWPFVADARP